MTVVITPAALALAAHAAAAGRVSVMLDGYVWVEYSPHYGINLGLAADRPETFTYDGDRCVDVDVGSGSSEADFVRDIMAVAAALTQAMACVPSGNRAAMGGEAAIAAALWTAARIAAYNEAGPSPIA